MNKITTSAAAAKPAYLPIIDAAIGACPVANSAGTAHIPQMVNNEAVILYFRIVSANGPVKRKERGGG
jgi:hypothetical protein